MPNEVTKASFKEQRLIGSNQMFKAKPNRADELALSSSDKRVQLSYCQYSSRLAFHQGPRVNLPYLNNSQSNLCLIR